MNPTYGCIIQIPRMCKAHKGIKVQYEGHTIQWTFDAGWTPLHFLIDNTHCIDHHWIELEPSLTWFPKELVSRLLTMSLLKSYGKGEQT